jgi:chromosome segregation ATPase
LSSIEQEKLLSDKTLTLDGDVLEKVSAEQENQDREAGGKNPVSEWLKQKSVIKQIEQLLQGHASGTARGGHQKSASMRLNGALPTRCGTGEELIGKIRGILSENTRQKKEIGRLEGDVKAAIAGVERVHEDREEVHHEVVRLRNSLVEERGRYDEEVARSAKVKASYDAQIAMYKKTSNDLENKVRLLMNDNENLSNMVNWMTENVKDVEKRAQAEKVVMERNYEHLKEDYARLLGKLQRIENSRELTRESGVTSKYQGEAYSKDKASPALSSIPNDNTASQPIEV